MEKKSTAIMVVDGSEVSRTIISRLLRTEMENAHVITCANASDAMEHLEREKFDLITTALMLPDMDGLDLSRRVRKSSTHHYTPIIVVSGDADSRLLREGFAAGVTDYFDKSQGYQAFSEFIKDFTHRNSGLVGKVLYVEDSQTAATLTCHVMEKHGLQVTYVPTAEQALELLEQAHNPQDNQGSGPDIVMTDFFLKGRLTGGDLLHAIRAKFHYSQQEMPVLVITANDNDDANNNEKQAEVFHAGANDFVTKPIVEEVLMARIRSLLLIKQQFTALKRQADEMRRLAITDSLTGVKSKRYLLDNGEQFLTSKHNQPVCALLLDIDNFKRINDNLGHITGDHVLAALGELLNQSFPGNAMIVRFGGEEFAILLPACLCRDANVKAEVLRRKVEQMHPANVTVTVSIGVASTEDHPEVSLTKLLALADKALYAAKERGRNRICIYSSQEEAGVVSLPPAIS
ncbi:MAG: diguanylate cyclase [Gammaproteobacteria bacterium]|nr:diguanylate cyclase [Gammaproteobacteria bacterium]